MGFEPGTLALNCGCAVQYTNLYEHMLAIVLIRNI